MDSHISLELTPSQYAELFTYFDFHKENFKKELKATRIAQSCGGGGGPGTGWGKRDDENDMDFRRRCFGMAMKMMKPGRQQRLKR